MNAANKTISILFFLLTLTGTLSRLEAQLRPINIEWTKSFGGTNVDRANAVIQASNGDFLIAGAAFSNDVMVTDNNPAKNQWIVRINAAGTVIWKRSYGSFGSGIYSIIQTSDGGFAAAGMAAGTTGKMGTTNDLWILKTDANGNIEWEKTYGGSEQDMAYSVVQTSDGGYALAGVTGSSNGDVIYRPGVGYYNYWVIKLNQAGNLLWSKTFGGSGDDHANSIIQTTDGGFAILGHASSADGDVVDHKGTYTSNAWLVKTNGSGDLQWSKSYGGAGTVNGYELMQTTDAGFVIGGIADKNGGDINGLHESGDNIYDYLLIKTDLNGTVQWSKCYGGSDDDYLYDFALSRFGGFILTGWSRSVDGDRKDFIGNTDYWVVSVDETGNIRWTKSYGGSGNDIARSITETINGGLIIAGASSSYNGHVTDHIGYDDYWVVRLNFKIATAKLPSLRFCAGDSIIIKDTLFGTFNRNNTFSVQLSDENGSFLTPSTIGLFPNTHNDTVFRVKLPPYIKTSRRYRIRVISSSPEAIYVDNGQDIAIYEQPNTTNDFLGKDTVICSAGSLVLHAPVAPGFQYTWHDNTMNASYNAITSGKYYVTVVNAGGCKISDTILVDFKEPLAFTLGDDQGICPGQTITLQPALPAGSYEWNNGNRDGLITITKPGLYWLQVSNNGCITRDSILIFTKPVPVISLSKDTTLCQGQTLFLDVTNSNATYTWQDGSTRSDYRVEQAGLYTVKVNMNGCDTTASILVAYKTKPAVELGNDTTICNTESIILQAAYPEATFLWSDGSTEPRLDVKRAGIYTVSVTNNCGTTKDSILVNYESCTCLYAMPTAFTPNKDGINDIFRPLYNCPVSNLKWRIYNRWGQTIFTSDNPSNGWNGQWLGQQQPADVYVWVVQYTDPLTNKAYQNKGTVLLIR